MPTCGGRSRPRFDHPCHAMSHVPPSIAASINLWVEDELTPRVSLGRLEQSAGRLLPDRRGQRRGRCGRQGCRIGGIPQRLRADRPRLSADESDQLEAPGKTFRTFVLPVHEVENYLLDPQALAASRLNTLGRTEPDRGIVEAAGRLTWWAACRQVVAELKRRFRESFVPDPPLRNDRGRGGGPRSYLQFRLVPQALARGCPDAPRRTCAAPGRRHIKRRDSARRRDLAH